MQDGILLLEQLDLLLVLQEAQWYLDLKLTFEYFQ